MKTRSAAARLASVLLAVILLFGAGCGRSAPDSIPSEPVKTQQELFDEFLMEEFIDAATSDGLSLNFLLADPAAYGITDYTPSWGDLSTVTTTEQAAADRAQMERFYAFDRAQLTPEQQRSYDIYAYMAGLYDLTVELAYYNDPLQGANGEHVSLPLLMSEYRFDDAQDVEDYLSLMEQLDGYLDMLLRFEQEKANMGLFMSDMLAQEVIDGCRDFIKKTDDNMLITTFDTRVGALAIGDSEKDAFRQRNRALFTDVVVPAYTALADGLAALKGSGKNDGGLAGFERGREYYALRLKKMGIDRTPEELIDRYDTWISTLVGQYMQLTTAHPDETDFSKDITPALAAADIIEFFIGKAGADFPALPAGVTWQASELDASVRGSLSPAMYFTPRLDDWSKNAIYYNPDYLKSSPEYSFFTMAHEGSPGHLLQKTSLRASGLSPFRQIASFQSYVEGWATYAQIYSYQYVDAPDHILRCKQILQEMDKALSMRIDLGVNYEGWDLAALTDHLKQHWPFAQSYTESYYKALFNHAVRNPLNTAPYELGRYEISTLKASLQRTYSDCTDKQFHEALLVCGEAPFFLIERWMEETFAAALTPAETGAAT